MVCNLEEGAGWNTTNSFRRGFTISGISPNLHLESCEGLEWFMSKWPRHGKKLQKEQWQRAYLFQHVVETTPFLQEFVIENENGLMDSLQVVCPCGETVKLRHSHFWWVGQNNTRIIHIMIDTCFSCTIIYRNIISVHLQPQMVPVTSRLAGYLRSPFVWVLPVPLHFRQLLT